MPTSMGRWWITRRRAIKPNWWARLDGGNGLLQDQIEHEERRRALLLSGCGLVPGAETGNPNHDSWRAAGERTVFRRLRASERHLLSVCGRAGAEGQCFARADLGREDRTKYSAGRHAFLYAGVQTGDEGATGWEVTIEKE